MDSLLSNRLQKSVVLLVAMILLVIAMISSVLFGLHNFDLSTVVTAYTSFDGGNDHLIIKHTRVPRAITAAVVGSSLAVAGVLLQSLTRNPLADSSIMGVNAGAAFTIVLALYLFGSVFSFTDMMWIGFLGAGVTAVLVYLLGSAGRGGMIPIKLMLSGAAVAAFTSSLTSLLMLVDSKSMEDAMYWLMGSVSGRDLKHAAMITPYLLCGWVVAWLMARSLNLMALGDDVAISMGQKTVWVKATVIFVAVLLSGGSVALAGPIGFVGIIIPHMCRFIIGIDHRWLIIYSAVLGALFLVTADLLSRFLLMPEEVPVGVATAVVGVPFVISLVRRRAYE
ncbi:FecCD family ABC transporter permease [Brevibacillus daliensis]|uniref:FecCD family ABC transporter permease n=1 Tax=Brevibacillus daliensis TaxID=2892995 RepID=UPI001E61171D|nr:iron ABC transporter permease [Brevibacillus daliensis]